MNELCNLINLYKNGNSESLVKIIDKFKPIIYKLERYSYCEDLENELILSIIILLDEIQIKEEFLKEDKYVFSYIYKSIRNKYLKLNKRDYKIYIKEISSDNFLEYNGYNYMNSNIMFYDIIKNLTDTEKNIIIKIYLDNLSEADIAREMNISRQAINKQHKKALNKLRKVFDI
ncbi:sigma factor-like helix-turn-helix DNA-binding protein [Clostridium sp. CCUG 7971]|uniref:sigma factor-like helix-turn-helix DNA-binding protein n=1 Tax=Clostridium sp. CCUG 7971 TaxID=2811414 RepID=UPI001ABBB04D|nr:sigma factor-like helix-turn-helix DNA-binding protein [Clostridium sp. CCUG 7971]MBO3444971.1 hypothetical protein [Clostridium sp. CCUG 7971]